MSVPGRARIARLAGRLGLALAAVAVSGGARGAQRGVVHVAVAANFAGVQELLAQRFTRATGYEVRASAGSTGQLYAQARNGAPFDVFLSADAERPRRLELDGLAVPGSRFTYAAGRLALYAPSLDTVRGAPELRARRWRHLAIADPKTAPYGAAAQEVLRRLGLAAAVADRLVRGENIGQTLQFVRSGAAELGFVAYSQVLGEPARRYWLVPRSLHAPVMQDAALLRAGAANPAARAYLRFLRGDEARRIIESHGYDTPR
ncbi:MAG TPA: molybdate ABC transporter substrate-binding protein [Longimicrobiales bacterium]|nr:molybdate ABC transporter substrate-binding protein [Longimicrobiales bacterium]